MQRNENGGESDDLGSSVPSVSVVMCVVDPHPVYFLAAVRSILAQSLTDLELVIIEEPSSASAGELLREIDDPRVRHFLHPQRTSLALQRNRSLEYARAELVAVMDADDIALPERLTKQLSFMQRQADIGVFGSQLILIDPKGAVIGRRSYPEDHKNLALALKLYNPLGHSSVMFRKSLVQAVGGYSDWVTEDYDLWLRMSQAGVRFANHSEALVHYRIHLGAIKSTKLHASLRSTIALKERYFGRTLGLKARLRIAAEKCLLLLPPFVVLKVFLAVTVRGKEG